MRRRTALLASIALALAAPAAQAQFEPRIIGGSTTTIEQYPWQAAVVYDPAKVGGNPFQRQFCGGSLVTPYIILTAAHCIHGTDPDGGNSDLDPDDVDVVLGQTTLSTAPSSSEHDVQGVSKQSNYDDSYGPGPGVPSNDVGYLVLQTPYDGATPIDIADSDESALWDAGSPEQITGWGATATSGPGSGGSDTLGHATVPIFTDSACASDYGVYFDSSTMVCAGYPAGGIDTCYGDSGGPMQAAIGGGAYRLVGITSWGSGCAEPDAPGVYTRVAGASLRPAVASTVFDLETTFGLPHEDLVGGTDLDPPPITTPLLDGVSDGTPPTVQASARLNRNGTVVLRLACDEECFANAAGSLATGRSSFKLKPAGTGIAAGSSALLRLAPKGRKARRAARLLLRGGVSGIARIVVTFADRGGNSTIRTLRVRKK